MELKVDTSGLRGAIEELIPSEEWYLMGEYLLTSELNRDITLSVEDKNPWYISTSPFGGPIANPAVLLIMGIVAEMHRWPIGGTPERVALHAKQSSEFINPARVGKKVRIEGRVVEKYTKRGKDYVVIEARFTDEEGVPLLTYKRTRAFQKRTTNQ